MPIRVVCHSCGRQLNAPDHLAGRKAKCPRCHSILSIQAAVPKNVLPPAPKGSKLLKRRQSEPEERITSEPEWRDDSEPEEKIEVTRVAKRPKRKKRKRPPKPVNQGLSGWVLWLFSVGAFALVAGSIALGAVYKGHGAEVLFYSVILAVMVPISTVILIVSMFISSWLGGGIEFGEARIVIPKAIGLLLVVNMIGLLPFGRFLAAPIWLFGLMFLFGLELWETRILVVVNWGLNFLAQMAVFAVIMTALSHGGARLGPVPQLGQQTADSAEEQAMDAILDLGGDFSTENDEDEGPVAAISLAGTRATDAVLARLKSFPKLQSLDLSSTSITDADLAHLERLTSLRSLNLSRTQISDAGLVRLKKLNQLQNLTLTGTRVTREGTADLQAALPRVRIAF